MLANALAQEVLAEFLEVNLKGLLRAHHYLQSQSTLRTGCCG